MGKAPVQRSRGKRRLPMDIILPCFSAIFLITAIVIADVAIDADITENADKYFPPPPEPKYEYVEVETFGLDGFTQEGASTDIDLGELLENATKIRAELTWQDDIGSNDVLRLALKNNGSEMASSEDASGSIGLETDDGSYNGTHSVVVTAVDCPGVVDIIPVDRDDGNSWSLKVFTTVRMEV